MFVIKRNGKKEAVHFDKITARIHKLIYGLSISEKDVIEIAKKVIQGIYDNVTTTELDNLAAETLLHKLPFTPIFRSWRHASP